jgi:methylmalonyl-CoA mutase C-terminal domain/subunit
MKRPHKIVFATDTPGHTAGYYVVARGLREAGFEVVTTGAQMPTDAAEAALQEDAEILAIRVMDKDPTTIGEAVLRELQLADIAQLPVLMGGIISRKDAEKLKAIGIAGVFPPGSKLSDIVMRAYECVGETYKEHDADSTARRR